MLILTLTVVAIFSFFSLGLELIPKIDLPTITVTVINPGTSPQEIETEITDKVESAVNTISGIDELRSTSLEGVSQVFITFVLEKNADVAAQEVRNKIDLIVNDLPETAEVPIVQKLDTDATPVLRIAVSAPRSLREVTDLADKQIKRMIESINGVGNVEIVGGRKREIEVWVDPDKMRAFNVSAADVASAVKLQNMELPGGRIEAGKRELTVRTMGRIPDPAQFNNLIVANRGPYAVKLSDIGYVEDGAEEQRTEARLNGQPGFRALLFRAIFDIADVAELDCVRPAIGYDQVIELRRIGNPSHRAHGQLALTCFDAPARQFHVLKLDRTGHVSRRDIEGAHFVGIDPDFDLTFASADDFHVADAIDRFDHALDLFVGQVGYFAQGSRRGHRNAQYRRGIGVELLNNWDFGCFWKIVDDKIDFV